MTPGQGVFTVPANQSALVTSIRIINAHASVTATINVNVRGVSMAPRKISKQNESLAPGAGIFLGDYVTLGAGDKIEIDVTAASAPSVDWSLQGVVNK